MYRIGEHLEAMARENPDIREMTERLALDELNRTLHLALIRCLEPDEIIARLPDIMADDDRGELLIRLAELDLTENQVDAVAGAVRVLAAFGDTVPSRDKPRIDGTIARIIKILPQKTANELVRPLIEHPRRSRRDIAYKSLRQIGVTLELARELIRIFRRTGDEKMLELIVRTTHVVADIEADFLLANLSEDYWRMRVLEALLKTCPEQAASYAANYPREFIWAVGRTKSLAQLPLLEQIAASNGKKIEILSVYAWTLGQIGAEAQLIELVKYINEKFWNPKEFA